MKATRITIMVLCFLATYVSPAFAVETLVTVLVTSLISATVTTGLQFAIAAIQGKPNLGPESRRVDFLREIQRSNSAPSRHIYGRIRISGVLAFALTVDKNGVEREQGQFLHFALMLANGPVAAIHSIKLNDFPATDSRFDNLAVFHPMLGYSNQPAVPRSFSLGGQELTVPVVDRDGRQVWTDQHRLRGIAYLWCVLKNNTQAFPSGAPTVMAVVDGYLVYDPRDTTQDPDDETTWAHSNNWALCCLDYARSMVKGLRIPIDLFDLDQIKAEADYCDELVETSEPVEDSPTTPEGTPVHDAEVQSYRTQARYSADGLWQSDSQPVDVMQSLLAAAHGTMIRVGGKWQIRSGRPWDTNAGSPTYDGPYDTLDPDDLRGPIKVLPKPGRKDRVNTLHVSFLNEEKDWQADEITIQIPQYLREDGGVELAESIDLPFVTNRYRAERIGQVHLKRRRQGIAVEAPCKPRKVNTRIGQVLQVTDDVMGWTSKLFEVNNWVFTSDGGVDLVLQEYADDVYTFQRDLAQVVDSAPDTSLPDPFQTGPPTDVTVSEAVHKLPDGSSLAKFLVEWEAPEGIFVRYYNVRYRHLDDRPPPIILRTSSTSLEIVGLREGSYRVTVSAVSQTGQESEQIVRVAKITYLSTPPPDVILLSFQLAPDGRRIFRWVLDREVPDLLGYILKYHKDPDGSLGVDPDAEWETATLLNQLITDTHLESGFPSAPGQYVVYVKALDRTRLESGSPAWVRINIPPELPMGVVRSEDAADLGWPGEKHGAQIVSGGALESLGAEGTWNDLPDTWEEWEDWHIGAPMPAMSYVHPLPEEIQDPDNPSDPNAKILIRGIDLGSDRDVLPMVRLELSGGSALMLARGRSSTQEEFGQYEPVRPLKNVRFVEFLVTVWPGPSSTAIASLAHADFRLHEHAVDEYRNDIDFAALAGAAETLVRRERRFLELSDGQHHNTVVSPAREALGFIQAGDRASARFDGATYLTAADAQELRLSGDFTIELTIRPTVYGQSSTVLLGKGTDWQIVYAAGVVSFQATGYTGDDPSDGTITVPGDGFMPVHLAFIREAGRWRGMRDGEIAFDLSYLFTLAESSSGLEFGGSSGARFAGIIEDVRIWSIARAVSDVSGSKHKFFDGSEHGLSAYWRADDGSGTSVADQSGNGYDMAAASGSVEWIRYAARVSPVMNLGVVQHLRRSKLSWSSTELSSIQSITVEGSIDGETWVELVDGDPLPWFTEGDDLAGQELHLRQWLESSDLTLSPTLRAVEVAVSLRQQTGDVAIAPLRQFATLDQAIVTAVQGGTPALLNVVARTPWGVRLQARDTSGTLTGAVVCDLLLRGVPLSLGTVV